MNAAPSSRLHRARTTSAATAARREAGKTHKAFVVFKQPLMSKCKDLLSADAALIKKGKDVCTRVLGKIRVDDTTLFKEFQKLDDDHDARLTKRELKLIIQKHCPEATSAEKQMMLFTIFSVADVNRDDSISFDEFKAIMQAKV